ncbi:MAG: DNA (cytosine-5-)-methyltransferase [Armatimonadetes bacterium]|nr:DNA (cytosine-5-)-methyltransferase [Armatimonadota bacterium]
MSTATLRVASFFAGIGGFDLGFERAGCKVVFQCERDGFCQQVLQKHWPDVPLVGDINNVTATDVPSAEIWCGGFPCQDLSLANQGKRKGLDGIRSGLFHKFAALAAEVRPKWLVLENVVGLLNSHDGEDFGIVLSVLDELGYCAAWRVLDSKYFGTPQRRRRTFVVASLETDGAARVFFDHTTIGKVDGPSRLPGAHATSRSAKGHRDADIYVIQHATIGRKPNAGPQAKGFRCDGEAYTLDSRGSSDVVCSTNAGFGVRSTSGLSRELDGRRFRALGNAVNVDVAEWIAKRIVSAEKAETGNVGSWLYTSENISVNA